jgi:hypothetical protein
VWRAHASDEFVTELVVDLVGAAAAAPDAGPAVAAQLLPAVGALLTAPGTEYFVQCTAVELLALLVRGTPRCLANPAFAQLFGRVVALALATDEISLMQATSKAQLLSFFFVCLTVFCLSGFGCVCWVGRGVAGPVSGAKRRRVGHCGGAGGGSAVAGPGQSRGRCAARRPATSAAAADAGPHGGNAAAAGRHSAAPGLLLVPRSGAGSGAGLCAPHSPESGGGARLSGRRTSARRHHRSRAVAARVDRQPDGLLRQLPDESHALCPGQSLQAQLSTNQCHQGDHLV